MEKIQGIKFLLIVFVAFFYCSYNIAQKVTIEIDADEIDVYKDLVIKVSIENDKIHSSVNFPEIDGFIKKGISRSSSMKVEKGKIISSDTRLQYYIPIRTGLINIRKFQLNVNGKFETYPGKFIRVTNNKSNLETETFNDNSVIKSKILGDYLSLNGHPKAKDVNMKIQVPIGWEVKEGDRPNIVKKFTKNENTYLIIIKDNVTFFSRKQMREALQEDNFVEEFVQETSSFLKNSKLLDQSVVTVDTYPSVQFKVKGKMERLGLTFPVIMKCCVVFYEDKIIFLQSMGIDNPEFRELENLFNQLTNSVIFPDQYDY